MKPVELPEQHKYSMEESFPCSKINTGCCDCFHPQDGDAFGTVLKNLEDLGAIVSSSSTPSLYGRAPLYTMAPKLISLTMRFPQPLRWSCKLHKRHPTHKQNSRNFKRTNKNESYHTHTLQKCIYTCRHTQIYVHELQ